jgi:hypothetical protein
MLKRLIAGAGSLVLVAGLGLALASSASAESTHEHFTIVVSGNSSTSTFSGPISGSGVDQKLTNDTDRVTIKGEGSFILAHHIETRSSHFDPATCSGTFTETGTWQIREATGEFAGDQGNGTYSGSGTATGVHTSTGCSQGSFRFVVHGTGEVQG